MIPAATGRTRSASASATGRYFWQDISSEGAIVGHGTGWSEVYGTGWLCAASCRAGFAAATQFNGDGSVDAHFFASAAFGAGGGELLGFAQIYVLADIHFAPGEFDPAVGLSLDVEAVGTADFTLIEMEDGGPTWETASGITQNLTLSGSVGYGGKSAAVSGSWSAAPSPSGAPMRIGRVDYSLTLASPGSIAGDFSATCDGIGYTAAPAIFATVYAATLSGGPASLTLSDGTPPIGALTGALSGATASFEPDWSLLGQVTARHYGGDAFAGAEVELRKQGTTGILDANATDASGYAELRYPGGAYYGGGLTAYEAWHLGVSPRDGRPDLFDSFDNGQQLSAYQCSVYLSEAWEDAYGTDGGVIEPDTFSKRVGLYVLPKWKAGNLAIATTHAYRLFDAVTGWEALTPGDPGDLTLDAGVWRFVPTAAFGRAHRTATFLQLAYRHLTLRVKSDTAGATFSFSVRLFRFSDPSLGDLFATATWRFEVTDADTWQDCPIDWLFPHEMEDQVLATGGLPQRYPFHPTFQQASWQNEGRGLDLTLTFDHAGASYWIESLTGAQVTAAGQVGATLHGPLPVFSQLQRTAMTPLVSVNNYPLFNWGWLVANGALGLFLAPNGLLPTVQAGFDSLSALYDDASRDTGLAFTDAGDPRSVRDLWGPASLLVEDLTSLPRTPASALTPASSDLWFVRRVLAMSGYYGQGESYQNGVYGATLIYPGDLWLDGEVEVLAWKRAGAVNGATLELLDNDTATVLDTAATDDDGLWAVSNKSGLRLPLSAEPALDPDAFHHFQFTDHGLAPPDYTPVGLILDSYWLEGDRLRFRERPANIAKYNPNYQREHNQAAYRLDVEVFTAQMIHYDVEVGAPSLSPDNLTDALNRFHRVSVEDEHLIYHRSDFNTPEGGWAVETDLGPDCAEPRLAQDPQELALRASVVYVRDAGVFERVSDNDAEDFEPEVLMIPGGTHPENVTSPYTRERLIAAYYAGSPGNIHAVYRGPGDADWSEVFTFLDQDGAALEVEDDRFAITDNHEPGTGFLRKILSVRIAGEDEVSEWVCDSEPDHDAPEMRWERVP